MIRTILEEAAAMLAVASFIAMLAVWAQYFIGHV